MPSDNVSVIAPASIANLGPGFDIFGLAMQEPHDTVIASRTEIPGVKVVSVDGVGAKGITLNPSKNTAAVAAAKVLEMGRADFGLELRIEKGVRICSGMGSSGASAAGGAFAANQLLEGPLSTTALVECAACGEAVMSGGFHADNVAPSLLGGFTIIRSYHPLEVVRIAPPRNLGIVACLPDILVPTKEARGVLPKSVALEKLVVQTGNAAGFVAAMCSGDILLLGRCASDAIVEPARAVLVPCLAEAKEAAMRAGAAGSFLGGSGPCVAALFDIDIVNGHEVAGAVEDVYRQEGISVTSWVTGWGKGCRRV